MVPDIGIGSSEPSGPDPSQRKHKSLRIGDLVYFAALAEDKRPVWRDTKESNSGR